MSYWNYRVLEYSDGSLGIHEVYYDDDGNVDNCTELPFATGDNEEELRDDLKDLSRSFELPRLKYEDF